MIEQVNEIRRQITAYTIDTKEQLEDFRIAYVGRKGAVAGLFELLKTVPAEERRAMGQELNGLKDLAQETFQSAQERLENSQSQQVMPDVDLTLPTVPNETGSLHPLTLIRQRIVEIFERLGFNVADGPEIEEDWYNFTALNFPENHPAREMQDTFFIEKNGPGKDILLHTHTSNIQVRLMETQEPPLRSIMPGRVYRNEAISARAHCFFHQIEGLYIDENVSFKDLKDTLYQFAQELFGSEVQVRFRPSYFPFTEPSAEMDISCEMHRPGGCRICGGTQNQCKGTGWVEILGSGMVDPNVLENCGIDSKKYTGFAFGMGIERIANLKYRVRDLRLYSENDVRFLRQFEQA
ncbi:phenylalanine--tRNA ligase subunit alpha [Siphonobacter sp. BAB-5385]|uniref:phenylalanine--tRNA ligase subunit alpha n=1 Tax=unclassified Siphonobacter TaxID=2635712 RepID=UPI000B9E6434|nr:MULTISPECIES: phenylalanine--tRNA ligase subunit alpha [unclassified Siphonobacter]OZI09629.1 phenylalanine--tRNA ligase subunit alpha [Siphonobacter sp. BAB-5385]PMD98288.1 phenylalanine--tRNA ligase subunit alpha [Siphonobacter sp. BAB-5405]